MKLKNEFTKTFEFPDAKVVVRKIYKEEFRIVSLTKYNGAYFSMDMEFNEEGEANVCYKNYGEEQATNFLNTIKSVSP